MTDFAAREYHRFEAAGKPFVYLVPSAAVFALDDVGDAILSAVTERPHSRDELSDTFGGNFGVDRVLGTLDALVSVRAIGEAAKPAPPAPKVFPLKPFPLTTMVLNVTNQCNLACTYCYEYSEDKIVDTENGKKPKFMTDETARQSVEFMLKESGDNPVAHLTFFGGETLLNFPVLQRTIAYARQRARETGKIVDFSLTTNATLLKPEIVEFLVENDVGVTISIDGPPDVQDKFRVFKNGAGSYDVVAPKIKDLISKHRRRPIGARVTLTSGTLDVKRIFRHLTEEVGFQEIGFAPATTAPKHDYSITDEGFDTLLGQFRELAEEFLEAAVRQPPSRVLERQGNARRDSQGDEQGVSLRRRSRPDGRGHRRRRGAVPSLRGVGRAQARHRGRRHRSRRRSARFSRNTTSTRRPTAASAGRGRSARAAAITRHTRATATRRRRTCITASGFADGRTSA